MTHSKRALDGVLLFDKPLQLSSNVALQKVRRLFRAEKAGHTGTLDPLATGLLPICFGEATKFTHALLDADKRYLATVRLGRRTSTGDAEGEVVEQRAVKVDAEQLHRVLRAFTGVIHQLPPMYSALKYQGKPLYEYIRQGETVERSARPVIIHELNLQHRAGDELVLDVRCSKGTYIRTLAEDIGEALGCGAHLAGLRRTGIGAFRLEDAMALPQLEAMDEAGRDARLMPLDSLVLDLPKLELDAVQAERLAQGQRLALQDGCPDGRRRMYVAEAFIGLGDLTAGRLSPERLLSRIAKAAAGQKST
ncbi:MAG: tRNA pseudouridine(55) synthase TruB [Sideroxydans sp.]